MADNDNGRLDSWKAIAAYLNRDERTVRRWERDNGLPVRRVPGGRGTSVFAYAHEIDEWLKTSPQLTAREQAASRRVSIQPVWAAAAAAIVVALAGLAVWRLPAALDPAGLRLETAPDGVIAFDRDGVERWRHRFSPAYKTVLADGDGVPAIIVAGDRPAAYVATSFRARHADGFTESGTLSELEITGRLRREFEFADKVTFDGVEYAGPWAITAFAVDDRSGDRRIAIAAHHHMWSASLVTILNDKWERQGTFVHAGWIESVRWVSNDRLLIAGYSDAHEGGMVALLDASAIGGQGPEPRGSKFFCSNCPDSGPLRMIIMPRTELNRVTVSRFNRAVVQVTADTILARPIEVPSAGQDAIDVLYEFTPALELRHAAQSARYWELHRALEAQGQLNHTRDACPDRDGPRAIEAWEPGRGWRTLKIG